MTYTVPPEITFKEEGCWYAGCELFQDTGTKAMHESAFLSTNLQTKHKKLEDFENFLPY
jgi:hypothetical protein